MKKVLIFSLLLFMAVFAFAEDAADEFPVYDGSSKAAVSIGPEWNMNSREYFAAGAVLAFDFNVGSSFALGITAAASSNFDGITVIEPAALFRFYLLANEHIGWFVQADLGAYIILEDGDTTPMFLGGLRGGLRMPLGDSLFIEPFGRVGYPFAFGVGCLVGIRF